MPSRKYDACVSREVDIAGGSIHAKVNRSRWATAVGILEIRSRATRSIRHDRASASLPTTWVESHDHADLRAAVRHTGRQGHEQDRRQRAPSSGGEGRLQKVARFVRMTRCVAAALFGVALSWIRCMPARCRSAAAFRLDMAAGAGGRGFARRGVTGCASGRPAGLRT